MMKEIYNMISTFRICLSYESKQKNTRKAHILHPKIIKTCKYVHRCSKKGLVLPIELALFSELWLGPRNGLGPIEVFPKAPFSKGSAI